MEINITKYFNGYEHELYSNNVATLGENAGVITYDNAKACDFYIITSDNREIIENDIAEYGAWSEEEIKAWSDNELNALVLQMISGDIREMEGLSWEEYEKEAERGSISGKIFKSEDGKIYYTIGN